VTPGSRLETRDSAWNRFVRGPAAPLAVILAAFFYQLPFFDRWFSFMDEGHILLYAKLIAEGGELYRDATVYPLPGAFYLLAWVFRFVEPSNLVARWILVVEFALLVGLVFLLLRRLVSPGWALGGVFVMLLYRIWAFPHWHMYNYSSTALLVQFAALLVLVRFTETDDRRLLPVAGLLFGLGVFCKQDYGAAALLAMGSTLLVYSRTGPPEARRSFWMLGALFIVPAALVGAATALHFLRQGMLGEFIQLTVLNHFVGMSNYEYSKFPSLLPLLEQDPQLRSLVGSPTYMPGILYNADWDALRKSWLYRETAIYDTSLKAYYYAPYLVVLWGAVRLWRQRRALREAERRRRYLAEFALFAFAAAFILLVTLNRPQDYVHLAVMYWPVLCLGLVCLYAWLEPRRTLAWVLAAVFLLPAGVAVAYTGRLAYRLRLRNSTPIESVRAGIFVEPKQARLLNELVEYVQVNTEPDEPVAVLPYFPILQFLADRRGPDRSSYIIWPFPEFPDRDRRVIDAMEATNTKLVVYSFNEFQVFEGVDAYAADLFAYLVENFRMDRVFSHDYWGYKLGGLRRSSPQPAGRPLLPPGTGGLTLSIRSRDAPPHPIPPDEQAEYIARSLWPFRPVIAVRPTLGRRTVLSVPLVPPDGARLETAVGIHPSRWDRYPSVQTDFELAIVDGQGRHILYSRSLRPTPNFEDRGWFEVRVPLDAWAGRPVSLEFSTQTDHASGEHLLMGGWEAPRIVTSAARDETP